MARERVGWDEDGLVSRTVPTARVAHAGAPRGGSPSQLGRITAIYRALRKGREDSKDEPGAVDFYYGEMEMRRARDRPPRTEAESRRGRDRRYRAGWGSDDSGGRTRDPDSLLTRRRLRSSR